jgi:hypothetical protein
MRYSDASAGVVVEDAHIGDLRQDPNNPRKHSARNIAMIERSFSETGAGRSVLADRNGNLIAGNGTIEAAANAGIEDAVFVHTDGTKLLVHVRDDLDINDPMALRAALYDNRSAELASWDADILSAMKDTEIFGILFHENEFREMIASSDAGLVAPPDLDADRDELGDLTYRVVVEFDSEDEQLQFLQELDDRGMRGRAVTV